MIIGVGHDVVEIGRISALLAGGAGDRFMRRVLTAAEYEIALGRSGRSEYVAGRFAAKEAVVKALGCGIGAAVGFGDIEIVPDALGKPCCTIAPQALRRLGYEDGGPRIHLSITHERSIASAFAVAER